MSASHIPGKTLVLLRHGRTAWNAEGRIQGQLDVEIDETGHAQAAAVAPHLAAPRPVALWSSDSARARQTAAYVAKETDLEPTYDERLREYFVGHRQGMTHDEYRAEAPEEFELFRAGFWDAVPGAETTAEVSARMVAALTELLAALEPGQTGIAVSHGAAIRDVVPVLLGWPVTERAALHGLENCGWVELDQPASGGLLRMRAY